jgi:hypothetical protein
MALSKGEKKMFDWLKTHKAGVVIPYEDVMTVTGWSESSLKTYITKRKLAPFLQKLQDQKLKVLMDGSDINEQYFQ